jgi:AcrR family transcriptional regulator
VVVNDERHMRADARRNHDRLLAAAREAFAAHGVDTSLDDIARRALVGPGTLYRHFPNRESLLLAVYREDITRLVAQAEAFAASLPPYEALSAYLKVLLEYMKHKRGMGAAVKSMLGDSAAEVSWCRQSLHNSISDLLAKGQKAGLIRLDVDSADVVRLVHGVGTASELVPDEADRLLGFVLDGLRPPNA